VIPTNRLAWRSSESSDHPLRTRTGGAQRLGCPREVRAGREATGNVSVDTGPLTSASPQAHADPVHNGSLNAFATYTAIWSRVTCRSGW